MQTKMRRVKMSDKEVEFYHATGLTNRQFQVLKIIADFIRKRNFPPSYREIMEEMGLKWIHGVTCNLKALTQKGMIEREGRSARGIWLTDEGWALVGGPRPNPGRVKQLEKALKSLMQWVGREGGLPHSVAPVMQECYDVLYQGKKAKVPA